MSRITIFLGFLVFALALLGLAIGEEPIAAGDLLALVRGEASSEIDMIVLDLRLPRSLAALMVGVALAVAGTISQAVMRNPLAEPGILGVNAGAAFAASLVIVSFGDVSPVVLPLAGFAGAAGMAAAVYLLAWKGGTSSLRIVLIGIGLGALASAGTSFLTAFGDVLDVQRALIWLSGTFYGADWSQVQSLVLWLPVPLALSWLCFRQLDLIRFGNDVAQSLGQRVNLARAGLILLCVLLSGAAIATAGLIGFVGLIAPHLARRLAGPGHVALIPVAALVGAALLQASDLIGRTIIAPVQIPAGLVTALIGAPFLAYILWGRNRVTA